MTKRTTPITCYVANVERAIALAEATPNSKAMTSGPGTLSFHLSIAQHGAGEFETLFVPEALRGKWREPAGGRVIFDQGE